MTKEEAEQNLQKILIETYFKNLKILDLIDKGLSDRVQKLSFAIENQIYNERYFLEFIEEDGDFDIYDIKEKIYLYNKKPKKYNQNQSKTINFDKKGYFSSLEKNLFTTQNTNKNVDIKNLQEPLDSVVLLNNTMNKYKNILKDDISSKKKNYKTINKFLFIGTLLGRHFSKIIDKIKAKIYFIHEPNLEIFRLSLFVFDYSLFLNSNATHVFFSIMEDSTEFENKLYKFLVVDSMSNYSIKYHTTDYNIKNSFHNVMNAIIFFKPTSFNFHMLLHNIFRNLCQRGQNYKRLKFPLKDKDYLFNEQNVIFVCSGPSLSENIDWLSKNKKLFTIVSIGSSYKKLLEYDIHPDIIVTIDAQFEDLNKLQFDLESCKKIQDCIVLASMNTDSRILKRFNPDFLYLFDVLASFDKNSFPLTGFSVGEVGYRILLELGVKNLYLLGTDLALNQNSGLTHDSSAASGLKKQFNLNKQTDSIKEGIFSQRDDLIKVKGNFFKEVYTNRNFNSSITFYNFIGLNLKKKFQTVYNLSNHGAFFENTIPKNINELKLEDINNKLDLNKLKKRIDTICLSDFSNFEKEVIKKELNSVKVLINILLELRKEYFSYDEFGEAVVIFIEKLDKYYNDDNIFLKEILYNYISLVNCYIEYVFNDCNVKKEYIKINSISELWFDEIKEILESYYEYLNQIKI